jgi:MIP family channel proteins
MARRLLAELIGTFAIVYCGVGAIALTESGLINGGLIAIAFAHGFAVMVMIYALGPISGAHFNPAISFALCLTGRFPWRDLPLYIAAQLMGSAVATALLTLTHGSSLTAVRFGATLLANGVSPMAGLLIEIVLTFFLALVIFRVAVLEPRPIAPILIGLTVMMSIATAGPLTGVALNPARAFGPALFLGEWRDTWIMWLGPVLGATLGAFTATWLHPVKSEEHRPRHEDHLTEKEIKV